MDLAEMTLVIADLLRLGVLTLGVDDVLVVTEGDNNGLDESLSFGIADNVDLFLNSAISIT